MTTPSSNFNMVRLEEVEDETFSSEKPTGTGKDGALLADDDDDYTDTGATVCSLLEATH